jgi:hypothetical protein
MAPLPETNTFSKGTFVCVRSKYPTVKSRHKESGEGGMLQNFIKTHIQKTILGTGHIVRRIKQSREYEIQLRGISEKIKDPYRVAQEKLHIFHSAIILLNYQISMNI